LHIVVTGSIAFDYLMSFPGKFSDHFLPDKLDRISVSFLVDSLKRQRGGVAANIAYSLALLGERPLLLATAGKDFGPYREELESVGVDTSGVKEFREEYTASFFVSTDQVRNQIASFYSGTMRFAERLSLKSFEKAEIALVVISPNDPRAMMKFTAECQEKSLPFIFDPSQQIPRLDGPELREGVRGSRMVVLNDYEWALFKKKTGLTDEEMLELSEAVVVTMGEEGSIVRTKERVVEIPVAQPERVEDPTGVGDAYRAGLMKGMVHGLPWEVAGRMGSLAATYVLETDGPQNHSYTLKAFVERYCRVFGESKELRRLLRDR
jgi:adenosine kinase